MLVILGIMVCPLMSPSLQFVFLSCAPTARPSTRLGQNGGMQGSTIEYFFKSLSGMASILEVRSRRSAISASPRRCQSSIMSHLSPERQMRCENRRIEIEWTAGEPARMRLWKRQLQPARHDQAGQACDQWICRARLRRPKTGARAGPARAGRLSNVAPGAL